MAMIEAIATVLHALASNIRWHCDVIEDCVKGFLLGTCDENVKLN